MPFPLTLMLNFTIPVLSGQPVLSGHLAIPREWPLNTGLTVNVIHQQNGARSSSGGFQDLSSAFQDWQYADKRHKWKEKVQWNAQFPFCGQTRAFRYEIVFRRIQPCFYTADRSAWLVLNQPRQRGFWRNLTVHSVLYGQGTVRF